MKDIIMISHRGDFVWETVPDDYAINLHVWSKLIKRTYRCQKWTRFSNAVYTPDVNTYYSMDAGISDNTYNETATQWFKENHPDIKQPSYFGLILLVGKHIQY
jgi:hypothetical protein